MVQKNPTRYRRKATMVSTIRVRIKSGMLELLDKVDLASHRGVRSVYWRLATEFRSTGVLRNPARTLGKLRRRWSRIGRRGQQYDRETVAVMRAALDPGANCVDVGAFRGDILREMLAVAPHGRHYAFEPLPACAAALRLAFPGVTVVAAALSDVPGRTPFAHVTARPAVSGLRPRPDLPANEAVETIEVEAMRLDDVLLPPLPTHFIKIDVEGAELLVLRGALETLRRWKPHVVFEHSDRIARPYGGGSAEVFDFLVCEAGLRLTLMSRWLRGEPDLDREGFLRCGCVEGHFYFLAHP
jgi:FkbM family methyltransferase